MEATGTKGKRARVARAEGGWFVHYAPGKPPIPGGMSIDYPAGLNLIVGILMALFHREKTGQGQLVSTDLFSVSLHGHAWEAAAELNEDKIDRHAAVGGTEAAINKAFATADGFIEVSPVFSDNALRDLSTAMELGDLSKEPQFATEPLQIQNRDELNARLAAQFTKKTTEEWIKQLEARGVFCARIQSFCTAMKDPQALANNMLVTVEHPRAGALKVLGTPVRLHATPPTLRCPPPDLGESSRAIAAELGYSEAEIEEMVKQGIIT
jgi:crotonobetainyl-CoA:carnitine CoA-transferase CaiB-like acyl-CoA transferase